MPSRRFFAYYQQIDRLEARKLISLSVVQAVPWMDEAKRNEQLQAWQTIAGEGAERGARQRRTRTYHKGS